MDLPGTSGQSWDAELARSFALFSALLLIDYWREWRPDILRWIAAMRGEK